MRAIVVKSHHHDTSTDVAALKAHGIDAAGIDVFGGIALNTSALSPSDAVAIIAGTSATMLLPAADPLRGGEAFERLVDSCLG